MLPRRYEGVTLLELTEWLRRGDMEREAQLLRVLDSVPLPKKLTPGARSPPACLRAVPAWGQSTQCAQPAGPLAQAVGC